MTISISMRVDMRGLTTDELRDLVNEAAAELKQRNEVGDGVLRPQHWEMLLQRLGDRPQAAVLREAARDENGYVTRARVLELLGRAQSRRLNGFRKPIFGAVEVLAGAEGFPTSVEPLRVEYDGPGEALGFRVDPSELGTLRVALDIPA